jgi:hypothetical protein
MQIIAILYQYLAVYHIPKSVACSFSHSCVSNVQFVTFLYRQYAVYNIPISVTCSVSQSCLCNMQYTTFQHQYCEVCDIAVSVFWSLKPLFFFTIVIYVIPQYVIMNLKLVTTFSFVFPELLILLHVLLFVLSPLAFSRVLDTLYPPKLIPTDNNASFIFVIKFSCRLMTKRISR